MALKLSLGPRRRKRRERKGGEGRGGAAKCSHLREGVGRAPAFYGCLCSPRTGIHHHTPPSTLRP